MQMTFTNGEQILGTNVKLPNLEEGDFEAIVREANYLKDCSTKYGYRDFLEIIYGITIGITEQLKKEKLMISQSENSRCYKFLMDIYKGNIPNQINISEFVGKECIVTIKHNNGEDGNVYANIVERKFN